MFFVQKSIFFFFIYTSPFHCNIPLSQFVSCPLITLIKNYPPSHIDIFLLFIHCIHFFDQSPNQDIPVHIPSDTASSQFSHFRRFVLHLQCMHFLTSPPEWPATVYLPLYCQSSSDTIIHACHVEPHCPFPVCFHSVWTCVDFL